MKPPLSGIKVLAATQVLPGGYCVALLSDLGADVLKIENPAGGDPLRNTPATFSTFARGNKSITINLRTDKGKEICHKLVRQSHVFIEGYRPGVTERLGIDYEALKKVNPKIIYASISGFGQDGPYRSKPAHDLTFQGVAGMLAGFVPGEGGANLPAAAPGDFSSGMFAVITILAALHGLSESGTGQHIDISMTDGLVSWMSMSLVPNQKLTRQRQPTLNIYQTKDVKCLTLTIAFEQHFWRNLCRAINREDLGELPVEERRERSEELIKILTEAFLSKTRDEWEQILTSDDVPHGPVYTSADEVLSDPQLQYRGMVGEIEDTEGGGTQVGAMLSPMKSFGMPVRVGGKAPGLGEHNEEILLALGYDKREIEEMKKEGVI
jgi:crotonobetainyl-CoA:carnitine CoA-transferase CaiB-like acyl-CoA transferase